jgi:membrane protein insertase Oxa1/YidC/SpoIIIJ
MTTHVERLTRHPQQIQKTQKKMKEILHIYLGTKDQQQMNETDENNSSSGIN